MKITSIETFLLKVALGKDRFYSSQLAFPERNSLIVKVNTDAGISGYGESGQYGPGEPVASFIKDILEPMLIGKNPLETKVRWEEILRDHRPDVSQEEERAIDAAAAKWLKGCA